GLRGIYKHRMQYVPYQTELDVPATILNVCTKPRTHISVSDFVGVQRSQKRRACVLILDTSGSMYGHLIFNAALTAAILSYNMRENDYAIVTFNTDSSVLKGMHEKKAINRIIDEILETRASGYTNITAGLRNGLIEMRRSRATKKFSILITDGNPNSDLENLYKVAAKFCNLHVIATPSNRKDNLGLRICEKISRLGNGLLVKVFDFKDIGRALQKLLLKL
ncbi:MAG: vWA domain-containing protein, partial [Promethearchaeota archaeon]